MVPDFEQVVAERRRHRRHGEKKGELGGGRPVHPRQHARHNRAAGPRDTGNQRQRLRAAHRQRAAERHPLGIEHVGGGRTRSTISMTMPPTRNAAPMTPKLP